MALRIERPAFERAVEALMICARLATDANGLRVMAETPRRAVSPDFRPGTTDGDVNHPIGETHDWKRIHAIALGAVVALVNGPVLFADETEINLGMTGD